MDVCKLTVLLSRVAAHGSLVLLGSVVALAGERKHELPTRPYISAAYSPNWGFNRTCWSRFPAVPECSGTCSDLSQTSFGNSYGNEIYPSQHGLYTPQNALMPHEQQSVAPGYEFSQSPVSVYPGASPAAPGKNSDSSAAGPANGTSPIPNSGTSPSNPLPDASPALPPLPAPPLPGPGQSSYRQNTMFPNRSVNSSVQTGARYGTAGSSAEPVSGLAPFSSGSFSRALASNAKPPATAAMGSRYSSASPAQQTSVVSQFSPAPPTFQESASSGINNPGRSMNPSPFSLASQSRTLPKIATNANYRSANAMPPAYEPAGPSLYPTQLPQAPNYPTMPSEPLRSTP